MIEKILENWLTKASERSYQLPFCFLLMQQGKTVVHLTRHCAMEHGKDIIAVDENGRTHVYQLKGVNGGRIKISDWQNMLGQLTQMVLTPPTHPSVKSLEHHVSYLVVNGDIDEEVQVAISAFNSNWEKRGHPEYRINTIVKGEILSMALANKEWFFPSEIQDIKSILEFFLLDGKGCLERGKLAEILLGHFDSACIKSDAAFRRKATSGALLCALCTTNYSNEDNHTAVVEAWVMYCICLLRATDVAGKKVKEIKDELNIAKEIIYGSIANLVEEADMLNNFLQHDTVQDAFTFRHRTTIVLGMIAWSALTDPNANIDAIGRIFEKNRGYISIWGESALPYLIAIYLYHNRHNMAVSGDQVIEEFLTAVIHAIFNPELGFSDVYTTAETSIIRQFSTEEAEHHSPRISYTLYSLLMFAVRERSRSIVQALWPKISECIFLEIEMKSAPDLYLWRVHEAEEVASHPELTQSWSELIKKSIEVDQKRVPEGLLADPEFIPLFWMVYPHRLTPNLAKLVKNHFDDQKNRQGIA